MRNMRKCTVLLKRRTLQRHENHAFPYIPITVSCCSSCSSSGCCCSSGLRISVGCISTLQGKKRTDFIDIFLLKTNWTDLHNTSTVEMFQTASTPMSHLIMKAFPDPHIFCYLPDALPDEIKWKKPILS